MDVPALGVNGDLNGFPVLPHDNPWNTRVDKLPVDPQSDAIIRRMGADKPLVAGFGANLRGGPFGMPYIVVGLAQQRLQTVFDDSNHSDGGWYPVPLNAPIEIAAYGTGGRHVIVLDRDERRLYELSNAYRESDGWHADTGAIFDLTSDEPRPDGWPSADEAGLPIFPGLVRFDEVHRGRIDHALRFTADSTRKAYVFPARHCASHRKDKDLPPMGMRVRLKQDFDVSHFPPEARVILTALKKYGMILADNGAAWSVSGAADSRWDDVALATLQQVKGSDFEVVQMNGVVVK